MVCSEMNLTAVDCSAQQLSAPASTPLQCALQTLPCGRGTRIPNPVGGASRDSDR